MTRLALGPLLGYAAASPASVGAAVKIGLMFGIAYCAGRVLGQVADALLGGTDELE